jgi:hypothetical protein
MIAKLTDGVLVTPPDKITFTNPPEQLLKDYAGYKDYIENPAPDYDPETQILVPEYTETDAQIVCDWRVKDLETEAVTDGV